MKCARGTVCIERHLQYRRWLTLLRGAPAVALALPRGHLRNFASSHRLGARLVRHCDCASCARRPPGQCGMRLHLCQAAFCSRTQVPSRTASTHGCFHRAATKGSTPRSSTLIRTVRSPRIILATCLRTGNPSTFRGGLRFADCGPRYYGSKGTDYTSKEETHVDSCPFCLTSEAGQVGLAAWFVSAVLCCFRKICGQ